MSPHCGEFIAQSQYNIPIFLNFHINKCIRGKTFRNIHFEICASLMSIKTASIPSKNLPNSHHLCLCPLLASLSLAFIYAKEIYFMINIKLILEPKHFNVIHTVYTLLNTSKLNFSSQRNQKWEVSAEWRSRLSDAHSHIVSVCNIFYISLVWFGCCNVKKQFTETWNDAKHLLLISFLLHNDNRNWVFARSTQRLDLRLAVYIYRKIYMLQVLAVITVIFDVPSVYWELKVAVLSSSSNCVWTCVLCFNHKMPTVHFLSSLCAQACMRFVSVHWSSVLSISFIY